MPSLVELLKKGQNASFKSLIDRMLSKPAFDNSEYNKLGLSGPQTRVGDIASMAIDAMPGIGDISAALKVPDNLRNKEYGQAALNSLGALPMVAGVGAIRNPAKSTTFNYLADDFDMPGETLADQAARSILNRYSKTFGTSKDPIYKAIDDGLLDFDKIKNLFSEFTQHENYDPLRHHYQKAELSGVSQRVGVPKHIAESEYMTPEALTDFIRQDQGTELQTSNPKLENIYDYNILKDAQIKSNFIDSIDDPMAYPELNNKFFRDAPGSHIVFEEGLPNTMIIPTNAIDYALKEKWITPQSIKDGKIGIPEMIRLNDKYEKAITSDKVRNTFEPKYEFDDGHKWVELKDADALNAEGKLMNNCVGNYCTPVKQGLTRIFSLRSPTNKSILNVQVDPATREIIQAHSNSNGPIKPDQKSYMDAFEALYHSW